MDFFFKGMNEETSECPFNENDIQRCPFLRNINKPTSFFVSSLNFPVPARGAKGPIFEDGPNFDTAFKLFHGSDGVVPLSGRSCFPDDKLETEPAPQFNPLTKAATMNLSAFGLGGPFSFDFFSKNWKNQKKISESSSQAREAKGPIFEDGPNFDVAFKLFHGRDGVVLPFSGISCSPDDKLETDPAPQSNPLAAKAATTSLLAFGPGGLISSDLFSKNLKNQEKQSESSKKRKSYSQVREAKGLIFEDGPNFDMAFKLFHGRDGVVLPLSGISCSSADKLKTGLAPQFNPLAAKVATMSLLAFGPGGLISSDLFSKNWKNHKKKSESSKKRKTSSQGGDSSKHERLGNVWLETGYCPVAKSYRAVSNILLLVATPFQPQPGMKLRCPPAVDAAMDALAQTAHDKTRLLQLFANMLVMGVLGISAKNRLGIWMEHTQKFFLSWFAAVHGSVPFIAMLRKSVLMPKNAVVFPIAGFILGLIIGSLVEHIRMKAKAEREKVAAQVANAGAKQFIVQVGVMSLQVLVVERKE